MLLDNRMLPFIQQRAVSGYVCLVSSRSRCRELSQVVEIATDMELVRVDVVALQALEELGRNQGCASVALDGLAKNIKTMFYYGNC